MQFIVKSTSVYNYFDNKWRGPKKDQKFVVGGIGGSTPPPSPPQSLQVDPPIAL